MALVACACCGDAHRPDQADRGAGACGDDRANGESRVLRTDLELAELEGQIDDLERGSHLSRPFWPWLLVIAGAFAIATFGAHGFATYMVIDNINASSRIETPNPVELFGSLTTDGIQVGAGADPRNRQASTRSLEQFVLDGTVVDLGLLLVLAGLFLATNVRGAPLRSPRATIPPVGRR